MKLAHVKSSAANESSKMIKIFVVQKKMEERI